MADCQEGLHCTTMIQTPGTAEAYGRTPRMAQVSQVHVVSTFMSSVPRDNFGARWTSSDGEDRFNRSFAEAYNTHHPSLHRRSNRTNRVVALEVPINGYGIADVVAISWQGPARTCPVSELPGCIAPTVRAFEGKLSNWRRGLMQAFRYRYFSDASILVMPLEKIALPAEHIASFRAINVGLWGFEESSGKIVPVFTPHPQFPSDTLHRAKAIQKVLSTIR